MRSRTITFFAVAICLITIALLAFTVLKRDAQGQQEQPERVMELPQIVSKISNLRIVNAKVESEGKSEARAILEIENTSDKSIVAIAIESGDDKDASGTNLNGFNEGDKPPTIVVKPSEIFKMEMPLANLRPGFPIRVSGVMYADGTEEGEKATLGTMHRQKEHYKNKKKGGLSPQ